MDDKVTIEKKRYQELLDAQFQLNCLEGFGVDNWDGYAESLEPYIEMLNEREET